MLVSGTHVCVTLYELKLGRVICDRLKREKAGRCEGVEGES